MSHRRPTRARRCSFRRPRVGGPIHLYRKDVDRIRDEAFVARGLRVVRIDADLVECDLDGALCIVRQALVAA